MLICTSTFHDGRLPLPLSPTIQPTQICLPKHRAYRGRNPPRLGLNIRKVECRHERPKQKTPGNTDRRLILHSFHGTPDPLPSEESVSRKKIHIEQRGIHGLVDGDLRPQRQRRWAVIKPPPEEQEPFIGGYRDHQSGDGAAQCAMVVESVVVADHLCGEVADTEYQRRQA